MLTLLRRPGQSIILSCPAMTGDIHIVVVVKNTRNGRVHVSIDAPMN